MHIFDVDHTLVSGSSGRYFIETAIREKVLPCSVMLSMPIVYFRYRMGKLKASHINRNLPQLRGIARETLERVAEHAFSRKLGPALFDEAAEYIRKLRASGEEVVIATSSIDIFVAPLAHMLEISSIIASSMEFDDTGHCTGNFVDAPAFGEEKRLKVLEFLAERRVAPEECTFYSDSMYDIPLLEAVGTPVAVNPDYFLARFAKRSGWQIMKFS